MMRGALLAAALAMPSGAPALAQAPPLPSLPATARQTVSVEDGPGLWTIATGPATAERPAPRLTLSGDRRRTAWLLPGDAGALAELFRDLRDGLDAAGWQLRLACEAEICGGYDFRHGLQVLPLPGMYVDLSGYLYLSATPGNDDAAEALEVILSPSAEGVHVQVTRITPPGSGAGQATPAQVPPDAATPVPAVPAWTAESLGAVLDSAGRVVLSGLDFRTGTSTVPAEGVPVLTALAGWLAADPRRRVALVGHSDWTGSLEANRALSAARARSVAAWLTAQPGVGAVQVRTEGVGWLAPRTGNGSAAGQAANRRVEAVLLPPG